MHGEIDNLFQLTLALHHLNKEMEKKFRLSLVQLFVLRRIRTLPGTSPQVLSTAIGIQPSTLTQTLRRLGRKEYIFVTEDPRDSRRKLIALTRRGNDAVEMVNRELNRALARVKEPSRSSLQNALGYCAGLRKALDGEGPGRSPRLDLGPRPADALE